MSQDAKDIFLKAVEIADEKHRAKLLDHLCGDQPELRHRVDALLEAHDSPGSFIQEPAPEISATMQQPESFSENRGR